MGVNAPWSTLRANPRDLRESAAANSEAREVGDDGRPGSPGANDEHDSIAWDVTEFGRRMAFGGIVGGITGITFGAMDGHRAIRDDTRGKFPTTALKTKEFMRLTALSGTLFTGFYCSFQGIKYGAKLVRKKDDFLNVLIASAGAIAPMVPIQAARARFPYAVILIAMDTLNNMLLTALLYNRGSRVLLAGGMWGEVMNENSQPYIAVRWRILARWVSGNELNRGIV